MIISNNLYLLSCWSPSSEPLEVVSVSPRKKKHLIYFKVSCKVQLYLIQWVFKLLFKSLNIIRNHLKRSIGMQQTHTLSTVCNYGQQCVSVCACVVDTCWVLACLSQTPQHPLVITPISVMKMWPSHSVSRASHACEATFTQGIFH